jgi:hypothetical protein
MNTRFGVLHENHADDDATISTIANETRKAEKKLREIAALKLKTQLTTEEREKLAKESYWKQFVPSTEIPRGMSKQEEDARKEKQFKRHAEKEKQKKARISAEELRKKKEDEERNKRLDEANAKYEQQQQRYSGNSGARDERRNWKFLRRNDGGVSQDEREQYEEDMRAQMLQYQRDLAENMFRQSIINEFTTAVAIHKTPDRAFRKLSLKYHPDKNPEDKDRAEKIQKILVDIRETYSV